MLFSATGTAGLFLLLLAQRWLPGGPDDRYLTTPMTADLAMNTAISFATTTTWQAYGGETTMSYLSQIVGLAAQNFLAGAAGLAVGIAFIRGLARERTRSLGNFWVDVTRATLWVLLPLSVLLGQRCCCVWQGVPARTSRPYTEGARPRRRAAKTQSSSRRARSPRWSPSRTSAPTAAASSTSTGRTPSRTRRRSRIFSSCWPSPSCPPRSPTPSGA